VCEACGHDRLQAEKKKKTKKKKRNKKSKGRKANHITGFQYAEVKQPEPELNKVPYKRKKTSPPREFNKEEYVKASFQFQLLENAKPPGRTDRITWQHVVVVEYKTHKPHTCPICMCPPTAGRATSCGHVFCYGCLYHHYHVSKNATCPLCHEPFCIDHISIARNIIIDKKTVGDSLEFILLERKDKMVAPRVDSTDIAFTRYRKAHDLINIFDAERAELVAALQRSVEYESFYINLVLQHMQTIQAKLIAENQRLGEFAQRGMSDEELQDALIYQSVQGDNMFLDPLCWKMLEAQYPDPTDLPNRFTAKITHFTKYTLNEQNISRNRHLCHLPLGCPITAVEVEMEEIVSEKVFDRFRPDIAHRVDRRKKQARESEIINKQIEQTAKEEMDRRLLKLYGTIDWDGKYKATKVATDDLNEFPEFQRPAQKKTPPLSASKPKIKHWNVVTQKGMAATKIEELWPSLGREEEIEARVEKPKTSPVLKGKKKRKKKKAKWRKLDLSPQLGSQQHPI